jgi:putative sterol carrier protein
MTVFKDGHDAEYFLGAIWERMGADPDFGPKLMAANFVARLAYTDPAAVVTVSCDSTGVIVERGTTLTEPTVTLRMTADMGNAFWLGTVSPVAALARKRVRVEGQIGGLMRFASLVKPAAVHYRALIDEAGRSDLLLSE